jgi:tetratricopeptide (TPR) repeat protein
MAERLIQLSVFDAPANGGPAFMYTLRLDDHFLAANQALTVEQSEQIREIHETYEILFVNRTPESAQLALGQIEAIGTTLFDLWLKPHWQRLAVNAGDRRILVVASALPEVLNLPWELLCPPNGSHIGTDSSWGVRRFPWPDRVPEAGGDLPPGPLRVLFFACSPRNLPELDFEREEEVLMTAVGPNVVMETASLGTFEELRDLVDTFKPHIVHLSGHGTVGQQGASFFFEDDNGFNDPWSAAKLGQRFSGSSVRCVFVSGCDAGSAPPRNVFGGICQAIVAQGVPMAIGWGASIVDEIATTIANKFYRVVAAAAPVDFALARARWDGSEKYGKSGDPSWSLPVLYAATADTRILNKDAPRERSAPSREQLALPGMSKGYARHLVGRRRELQAVVPGLRDGSIRGVVLTGLAGVGKSSLATRLARKLEGPPTRLRPIAISCSATKPLTPEFVLGACRTDFLASGRQDAAARTKDPQASDAERLRVLVHDLSDEHVLILDNFDNSLDEATRKILDPKIAELYQNLLTDLFGSSRVLLTSRSLPADLDPLPDGIVELTLGELSEAAYLKFMFRDARVQKRYQAGAAEREVFSRLYQRFGAAPSLVAMIRAAFKDRDIDPLVLREQIEQSVRAPDQSAQFPLSMLEQKHADFCSEICIERLYGRLSEPCKHILARLSVYPDPLALADAMALTGCATTELQDALATYHRSALMHPEDGLVNPNAPTTNWSTYGSLRHWLTLPPRLPIDHGRNAHRAAGDYLVKLFEQSQKDGSSTSQLRQLLQARSHFLAAGASKQAREVTYSISSIMIQLGEYAEIERLNAELLKEAEHSGQDQHPDPITWIARTYLERAEFHTARAWYQKALAIAGDQHPREKADALQGLATICIREGHKDAARKQLEDALQIQLTIDDRNGQGISWHQLASIDFDDAKYDDARTKFNIALELQKGRSPTEEQAIWHQLGSIDLEQSRWDEATNAFNRVRDMAREMGSRKAEANAAHQLGRARFGAGARQEGLNLLRTALTMRRAVNDRAGEALSFRRLAEVAGDAGDSDLALRLAMVGYGINSAIQASTTRDLAAIERWTAAVPYPAQEIERMQAEVTAQYLADRGKTLLKRLRARP